MTSLKTQIVLTPKVYLYRSSSCMKRRFYFDLQKSCKFYLFSLKIYPANLRHGHCMSSVYTPFILLQGKHILQWTAYQLKMFPFDSKSYSHCNRNGVYQMSIDRFRYCNRCMGSKQNLTSLCSRPLETKDKFLTFLFKWSGTQAKSHMQFLPQCISKSWRKNSDTVKPCVEEPKILQASLC